MKISEYKRFRIESNIVWDRKRGMTYIRSNKIKYFVLWWRYILQGRVRKQPPKFE